MMRSCVLKQYERGSALVEFSLLAAVMLPLGLGISMIGKLTDLAQTTEQAGRYTAWEATVYSRTALSSRASTLLDTRFFQAPDTPLVSKAQTGRAEPADNPLWGNRDKASGGLREWARVSRQPTQGVASRYAFDTGKAAATLVSGEIAAAAGKPLSGFKDNSWGLVADGLLRSSVEVAVEPTALLMGASEPCGVAAAGNNSASGDSRSVCVKGSGVILADGWAATDDAQAVSRVRSLVPASTMQRVGEGVGALLGSVVFPELDSLDKAFGHVDMGVLPEYARP